MAGTGALDRLLADYYAAVVVTTSLSYNLAKEITAMMGSLVWMLACPLGMAAMGGGAWVLSRLPGRQAERLARISSRANCMPMGARHHPPEVTESANDESAEEKVPAHV